MKPLKLTLCGIKSFIEEQTVDFTLLGKSNIFVVCGITGAGKSTILDSIILALYGNKGDRGGLKIEDYINLKTDRASVALDFEAESGGVPVRYRVSREFFRNRTNKATLVELPAETTVCAGSESVNARITEMIGLTADNFTKVIVLEQGKYGEFLKATKAKRTELVGSLFKLEKYRELYNKASTKKKAVQTEIAALDDYLGTVKEITATAIEEKKKQIRSASRREKELAKESAELTKKRDELNRAKQAYGHYADAVAALEKAEKEFAGCSEALAKFEKEAENGNLDEEKLASLAEQITVAKGKREELFRLKDVVESLKEAEKNIAGLRKKYSEANDKLKLAKQDEIRNAGVIEARDSELEKLGAQLARFGIRLDSSFDGAAVQRVIGEYNLAHSASALASSLKVGDVCPVCGATVKDECAHITDEDFKNATKLLGRAVEVVGLRESEREALRKAQADKDKYSAELEGLLNEGKARSSECDSLKKQTAALGDKPYEDAVKAAESTLARLEREHAALKKELDERESVRQKLTAEKTKAEGTLEICRENEKKYRCAEPNEEEFAAVVKTLSDNERERRELVSLVGLKSSEIERYEKELAVKREKEKKKRELSARSDDLSTLMKMFKGDAFLEFVSQEHIEDFALDASDTLSKMTGGCYTMGYDPESEEFFVRDFRAGNKTRSVLTLSGGETFLASLSLAIAVSRSIAEKNTSGLKFDFLFLDEGFGTLHEDAIWVVERALRSLSRETLVGIVTHRSELSELIPDKLVVEQASEKSGSRVKIVS